jgi:DNA-directed RNA polymerase subunit E'
MYKIITVEDKIRVHPSKFGLDAVDAIKNSLEERWEGLIDKRLGVILSVISVETAGEGSILPGDGSVHYPVSFKLLVYRPELHEVILGNVIDVTEFGIFVRIGPIDGMIHVSQIMDDFVSFDEKNSVFTGRESKRLLKEKDTVKARIVSISLGKEYKIGITTRQPGLGVLGWLERAKAEGKKPGVKPAAKPKPPVKKGGKK